MNENANVNNINTTHNTHMMGAPFDRRTGKEISKVTQYSNMMPEATSNRKVDRNQFDWNFWFHTAYQIGRCKCYNSYYEWTRACRLEGEPAGSLCVVPLHTPSHDYRFEQEKKMLKWLVFALVMITDEWWYLRRCWWHEMSFKTSVSASPAACVAHSNVQFIHPIQCTNFDVTFAFIP